MARSDIDALNATFALGLEKGDAELVASVYAPDAQAFPPGADVLTGPAIQAFWQGAIDAGLAGSLETVGFEEHGDVAIEHGRFELVAGSDVVDRGKYVVVHRRQPDGTWRLGLDIWNSSEPAASPA
jgi:ketosteroid isomerase-like protein